MSPVTLTYAFLAGVIPAFIWLAFWLREDVDHPEPRWLIVGTFAAGAISVVFAIFGEKIIADMGTNENVRYSLWAALEEIVKFAAVLLVALRTRWNDEPIDAMIYAITAALGFSAVENALFLIGPLSDGAIIQGLATGSLRFVGATLVHTVSSAMIGFALGLVFYRGTITKIIAGTLGLAGAIILHASFNLSIINSSPTEMIRVFVWIWAAVLVLILLFEEIKSAERRLREPVKL